MNARYFFDASALVGLLEEHASYSRFRDEPIVTERGHLYEFIRYLLKTRRARDVLPIMQALRCERVEPEDEDLLEAAKIRAKHPRMSGQLALGYALARRESLKFLTSDTAFRRFPGAEYVD